MGLASALLSFAHGLFGPGIWPGDWVWATSTAGALVALLPALGAMVVAIIRKGTGNRYDVVTLSIFGGIGAVAVFLLPWLLATGVSQTYQEAASTKSGGQSGFSASDLSTFNTDYSPLIGKQSEYLGRGQNVYEVLFYPSGMQLGYVFYLILLVGLPALALLFVMLQARTAFRRGPKWPSRFFWIPFVLMVLASVGMGANTAVHFWLGFLPFSVLGLIPVALVGPPPWSVINRPEPQPRPKIEPYRPEPPAPKPQQQLPPPPPAKQYPATALAQAPEPPALAAMPGPVPAPPGSRNSGGSRYKRVRRLGHGGFGTVWEAIDTQLNRTVALKIAHAPDRDTEERMQREARALAVVNHPNCVRVYDLVEEPDGLALVMEYLEGKSLAEIVDSQGPLDDIAAGRLWSTMAGALAAAHEKGVLHRDLKPSNIILDRNGLAHLIDFGIARSQGDSKMTATGMMIGTPDFVAPEQAMGSPASPASDAWQLAATVSYALSGQPPRGTRETPMAALMAAARAEPVSKLPNRSAHARILIASLDQEPRRRPTLAAVRRDVEGWLARAGKSPDGPVTQIVPRRPPQRQHQPQPQRHPR
ncbi:serine/threonine-protein kinase [Amycolatopsis regifaucium]|uniref:Serine/threonine protein kinase n=1 Tax=Amycolatopsis regifaucium TaxID=546365 RepID=A0A154MTQ2_9PSEU|nr:serine/threonine-protein kinase [Amycolatopsis regifaucium]KZB87490.1 serine/threonine protein kinase [Amycolatopsis regifaucium]OKA08323.1 serine/threonine protein kinase [Amycolatopsis regifaucium]SFI06936.1 Serine/threonine protein kinase [Amycolatopsis regifaucium]